MLAEHRDLQDDLRENPDLIPMFVEEALRLEPPFRYHMRFAPKETALGGVEIPAGATVLLLWGAANRDPAMFDHPETIDLTRHVPRRHVAFGRVSTIASGRPLLGSKPGLFSASCLPGRAKSTSILNARQDGRTASWFAATKNFPCAS